MTHEKRERRKKLFLDLFVFHRSDLSAFPPPPAAAHTGDPVISAQAMGCTTQNYASESPCNGKLKSHGQIQAEEELFLCKGYLFFHFTCCSTFLVFMEGIGSVLKPYLIPTVPAMGRWALIWTRMLKAPSNLVSNTCRVGASTTGLTPHWWLREAVLQTCYQETEKFTAKPPVTWHQFVPQPQLFEPHITD